MNDLTALVLTLTPDRPITMSGHLGRASHAMLLRLLASADPALAQMLHDSNTAKPFTCSDLIGGERVDKNARRFTPDKQAWLRLTGLTSTVSALLQLWATTPPEKVELDGAVFTVQTATIDPAVHPWAGQTSCEALSAPHLLAQQSPAYRLSLEFASPTTFRSQGRSLPVPMPEWVFGSLLDRWNAFATVQLPTETRRFAAECVVLSRYRLHTRAVPYKDIVQMGCVGWGDFVALQHDRYWNSVLNLLADFAFYSGVGYQTTVGLGQVRRKTAVPTAP
ncbi:MAG: CRISPR system precrRNA processing endoribonuclease RAMP protein Cas6 [Ardenticatenaceae bacterium]|nr:CRISPR system precrRNA processing endoribonuclease RAMP protein Cas6 [Ardenticatenaceae bacterium]